MWRLEVFILGTINWTFATSKKGSFNKVWFILIGRNFYLENFEINTINKQIK